LGTDKVSAIKHLLQLDPNAMWANFSLTHYLTSAGFVVSPKLPGEKEQHPDDGYTVQFYGSSDADGIDATDQIEMAPSIHNVIEKRHVLVQILT